MTRPSSEHHTIDGFAAITLRSDALALTIVPALGARMVSLRSRSTRREWLWRPRDGRGLFACGITTPFENGPIAGIDECLPSVLPCDVDGGPIPDHGEAWSRAWRLVDTPSQNGVATEIALSSLPLIFRRGVSLERNIVQLDYTLTNDSPHSVRYLWALHPLFTLEPGDRVELGGDSDVRITAALGSTLAAGDIGAWPSPRPGVRLDEAAIGRDGEAAAPSYCKAFLSTLQAPTIALVDGARGERLTIAVDPRKIPAWGYWVSRGGWHGHTHIALEASNALANGLDELTDDSPPHTLAAHEVRPWRVTLALEAGKE